MAAANALAAMSLTVLREHSPFDEMDGESLRFLVERLALAYYARGSEIVGPESGTVDRLFIVKQGTVRGSGVVGAQPAADVVLGAGECFPVGALIGRRAAVYSYRAESDVFCWELPAEAFHALVERSLRFHAFCTGHLAMLVDRAHRASRAAAGEALIDASGMLAPLRSVLKRDAVSCAPATTVRDVLKAMHASRIGSMVVADPQKVPVGIFTTADVLVKVAAPQAAVDGPISSLMTPGPVMLEEDATLADAAIAMVRHGIRHVVVTRDGRLSGVVSERDLFALQRVSLRRSAERIHFASSTEELVLAADDIRALARHLLAHGVAPEQLTAMISALNDSLSQKTIAILAARHALAPHWCWIALGSEGRLEQTLVTDQDNALIFVPEKDEEASRRGLLAFAGEVNVALDRAGFPLCEGDIMARNPRWCLSTQAWRCVFDEWIRNPDPDALLHASIFFDLRPLAGDARLVAGLRESVLRQTCANRTFLRAMTQNALRVAPPLGLLRDFAVEEIDLKGFGARPYVDAARVLALAAGRPETGTAARLRAAGERAAADGFHFIQGLRLRYGNLVRVAALSAIDRRVLKEAFRQAALLQARIRLDFKL